MNRFERKETYKPEEVLPFLPDPKDYPPRFKLKKIKRLYDGDEIKMGSQRYYVFRESLCCAFCGLKGEFLAKERHLDKKGNPTGNGSYHLNLYGYDKDGNEVMLTKDHIIPKAKGGRDILSNYQTACKVCNEEKRAKDDDKYREMIAKREAEIGFKEVTKDDLQNGKEYIAYGTSMGDGHLSDLDIETWRRVKFDNGRFVVLEKEDSTRGHFEVKKAFELPSFQ